MKKLIFILPLILLILSCEEVLESIKEGCTTATACNYDATAMKDDGSCVAPQGCNEWCEGDSLSIQELDCFGICGGTAYLDNCNVCDTDLTNDCKKDCDDIWGGENNLCLNSNYKFPLHIGNKWVYDTRKIGFENIGEEGNPRGQIITTILDTVIILDSILTYKFQKVERVIDILANDTTYIYANNTPDGFFIYASSHGANFIVGSPRARDNQYLTQSSIFINSSFSKDCNNEYIYYNPPIMAIKYPILKEDEWEAINTDTEYTHFCPITDSLYTTSPILSIRKNSNNMIDHFEVQLQIFEVFGIGNKWHSNYLNVDNLSSYQLYSNAGMVLQNMISDSTRIEIFLKNYAIF